MCRLGFDDGADAAAKAGVFLLIPSSGPHLMYNQYPLSVTRMLYKLLPLSGLPGCQPVVLSLMSCGAAPHSLPLQIAFVT